MNGFKDQILTFWLWFFGKFYKDEIKILPPLKPIKSGRAGLRPHHKRTREVLEVLETLNAPTYEDAIQTVRQKTGTGCSRRIISKWKKQF